MCITHLVVGYADWLEALVPQRSVSGNFCRQRCQELRHQRGVGLDCAIRIVVAEHFPGACERKWLNGDVGLFDNLDCFRVACIGEECGSKRVKDASEWVVSRASDATDAVQHSLVVVVGLTFTTDLCLFIEYHGLDALLLEPSCRGQACGTCADDAHGMLSMAVRPS